MGTYTNEEQRRMDQDAGRQNDAHERQRKAVHTCIHSLFECPGCQVAREISEKREALEAQPRIFLCGCDPLGDPCPEHKR